MLAVPQLKPFSLPSFSSLDQEADSLGAGPLSLTVFSPNLSHETSPQLSDDDLTSLNWLQKPGVLNSMCNALTGSPHCINPMGCRSSKRRTRSVGKAGEKKDGDNDVKKGSSNTAEKMLNVVLSVRNKRYDGEDSHKPPLSFACMIFMALESSPTKTLPVKQVYEWIQWKFPYYATALPGWKNSIRHNLSLNKCFQKVEKLSRKSRSVVTKGGLWTVDSAYRESIISALKMNPYHPYHKYFVAPYFPRSMIAALRDELELVVSDKGLDPAERDAALSICLISGAENGGVDHYTIKAIHHDHCYTQLPTLPPSPTPLEKRSMPNLDEVLAAAEMILGGTEEVDEEEEMDQEVDEDQVMDQEMDQEAENTKPSSKKRSKRKRRITTRKQQKKSKQNMKQKANNSSSSVSKRQPKHIQPKQQLRRSKRRKMEEKEDEVYHSDFNRQSDDNSDDNDCSLADSGYSGTGSSPLSHESRSSSLDDIRGANALLCLANNSNSHTPSTTSEVGGGEAQSL